MATSSGDYFANRPAARARQPSSAFAGGGGGAAGSPGSPRTPQLGRSISSQFGSPSTFRSDQEDQIIYELGARHLSAGFAGESRPRCILHFTPEQGLRVGDYRACDPGYRRKRRKLSSEEDWSSDYELYRSDVRTLDLGLVEDKIERTVRTAHTDYLQLDQKPRKAVLVVPSLLPTPLLEVALKVLFNHYAQPPSVVLLTTPLLACVGAGVRNALVIDLGWEETVVTAIGEYKEVFQKRSVRAGKLLTREMARLLEEEMKNQSHTNDQGTEDGVTFEHAEEVTQRMAWCRSRSTPSEESTANMIKLPSPSPSSQNNIHISFIRLSKPAETAFFTNDDDGNDDHNLPLPTLAYLTLLALPLDLRALCTSRILITGGPSHLPGLKPRILQDLAHIISTRGWDPVHSYGSARAHHDKILRERSANIAAAQQRQRDKTNGVPLSPSKKPIQDSVPHSERVHDDREDPLSRKAEARGKEAEVVRGEVRGVETLGAWAGASLVASLRVGGVHEVEREEFMKGGFRDAGVVL